MSFLIFCLACVCVNKLAVCLSFDLLKIMCLYYLAMFLIFYDFQFLVICYNVPRFFCLFSFSFSFLHLGFQIGLPDNSELSALFIHVLLLTHYSCVAHSLVTYMLKLSNLIQISLMLLYVFPSFCLLALQGMYFLLTYLLIG